MGHEHILIDEDKHFIIDPDTRKIEPATPTKNKNKNKLMQMDHMSECYTFEIQRVVEGHDMSLCTNIEINYINLSSDKTKTHVDMHLVKDADRVIEEDKLIFKWDITNAVTQYDGTLSFAIRLACLTDANIDYDFHTDIHTGILIGKTYLNAQQILEEHHDLIEQLKLDIFEACKIDDAKIYEAVNSYLAANPVKITVDSELSATSENPVQNKVVEAVFTELKGDLSQLSEDIKSKINPPSTATIGQTIVVKEVDELGKPTEWEAADLPTDIVKYTEQTLTDEQKSQARTNIGVDEIVTPEDVVIALMEAEIIDPVVESENTIYTGSNNIVYIY